MARKDGLGLRHRKRADDQGHGWKAIWAGMISIVSYDGLIDLPSRGWL
jgi:hypothetical protein